MFPRMYPLLSDYTSLASEYFSRTASSFQQIIKLRDVKTVSNNCCPSRAIKTVAKISSRAKYEKEKKKKKLCDQMCFSMFKKKKKM